MAVLGSVGNGGAVDSLKAWEALGVVGAGAMAARLEAAEANAGEHVIVEPENGPAVRLFLALQTQWIIHIAAGLGGAIVHHSGLRYEAIPVAANALGVPLNEDVFYSLRALESYSLDFFREGRRRG